METDVCKSSKRPSIKPLSYAICEQKVRLAYMYLRWIQRCFNHVKTYDDHGNWHPIKHLHSIPM